MRRRLGLLAALTLVALPAAAQDDVLQPDVAPVFGYNLYEATVGEVFDRDPAACRGGVQMITLPSFTAERSAGICRTRDGFVACAAVPRTALHYAGLDTTGVVPWSPDRARTVEVDYAEARIDSATAARVADMWAGALRTTRQLPDPDPNRLRIRADGETTHFASFAPVLLTAHAWSPQPGSVPGTMIALGGTIEAVARGLAPAGVLDAACARLDAMLAAGTNP